MHKLIEYICDELEELERKADKGNKLSMQEVQYMDTLAHAKKNLLKSEEMMEEDEGYSMARERYSREGMYSNEGGYSNARGGRGRGSNARRDSMGRYSSDRYSREGSGYSMDDDFRMELQELMQNAPNEQVKQKLQRIMSEM
jgi:hypothetical protein